LRGVGQTHGEASVTSLLSFFNESKLKSNMYTKLDRKFFHFPEKLLFVTNAVFVTNTSVD
jgi:hypothetical protein